MKILISWKIFCLIHLFTWESNIWRKINLISNKLSINKFPLLDATNSMLAWYNNNFMVSDLRDEFWEAKNLGQLKYFFMVAGVLGMLGWKYFSAADMVFQLKQRLLTRRLGTQMNLSLQPVMQCIRTWSTIWRSNHAMISIQTCLGTIWKQTFNSWKRLQRKYLADLKTRIYILKTF